MDFHDVPTIVGIPSFTEFAFKNDTFLIIGLGSAKQIAQVKKRTIMKRLGVKYCYADLSQYDLTTDIQFSYDEKYKFKYAYCIDYEPATCPEQILDIIRDACNPV
ncbi:hypothetical protein IW146_003927 [Coemansia sp. RSA 922]|nr:hypothetical protein GGH13_004617 [Coemansia sp. S155-1]KAJ2113354.1 hypothetical protein IW146_003927 [Coemansia sp. RSA 922]KAJ2417288.1 hypothetical protein GGF41_005402 [Coemansia sp. RSA 2531]